MPPSADPSVHTVLAHVQQNYPNVPFLALGQTVFWDEPVKAVWRHLLDAIYPEAHLIAGVHDTDYFAKTTAHIGSDRKYVPLPHDDGRTRDLWSAAGEMSSLFGSESVPTRAFYEKHGVPFDSLAREYSEGRDAFYREFTSAWGWRGIVRTESHDLIAHDIPIWEIKEALLEQLDWAFEQSLLCLDQETRQDASRISAMIRCWVTEFLDDCDTHCRLSDLYQTLLPRLYETLLGTPASNFSTTASSELFVFNTSTCLRPRFGLLAHYLNPRTCKTAGDAYNKAVAGSGIYTLDHFGDGAVPFDVVIPGQGRGTLRVTPDGLIIETQPTPVLLPGRIDTLADLAQKLETAFGSRVLLVGKAVTLIDMLAAEYLVVFHETASAYTTKTNIMNKRMRDAGMALDLYPIVRLTYPTWDALRVLPETLRFQLPAHLAQTFCTLTISAPQFAMRWRDVLEEQRTLLRTVRDIKKTRSLMSFLASDNTTLWELHQTDYEDALLALKNIAIKSETLASRINEHEQQWDVWKIERQRLERRKGDDWRTNIEPLREKLRDANLQGGNSQALQRDLERQMAIRATAFDDPLALCRDRIDATKALIAEFRRQRRLLERSKAAREARETIALITQQADMARLYRLRNAYLTIESLEHTNLRPTAWWLPLIDPARDWFGAIADGTQAHLEFL